MGFDLNSYFRRQVSVVGTVAGLTERTGPWIDAAVDRAGQTTPCLRPHSASVAAGDTGGEDGAQRIICRERRLLCANLRQQRRHKRPPGSVLWCQSPLFRRSPFEPGVWRVFQSPCPFGVLRRTQCPRPTYTSWSVGSVRSGILVPGLPVSNAVGCADQNVTTCPSVGVDYEAGTELHEIHAGRNMQAVSAPGVNRPRIYDDGAVHADDLAENCKVFRRRRALA